MDKFGNVRPGDHVLISVPETLYEIPEEMDELVKRMKERFPGVEFTLIQGPCSAAARIVFVYVP